MYFIHLFNKKVIVLKRLTLHNKEKSNQMIDELSDWVIEGVKIYVVIDAVINWLVADAFFLFDFKLNCISHQILKIWVNLC